MAASRCGPVEVPDRIRLPGGAARLERWRVGGAFGEQGSVLRVAGGVTWVS